MSCPAMLKIRCKICIAVCKANAAAVCCGHEMLLSSGTFVTFVLLRLQLFGILSESLSNKTFDTLHYYLTAPWSSLCFVCRTSTSLAACLIWSLEETQKQNPESSNTYGKEFPHGCCFAFFPFSFPFSFPCHTWKKHGTPMNHTSFVRKYSFGASLLSLLFLWCFS